MRNFMPHRASYIYIFLVLVFALITQKVKAEGTPTLSPNSARITGIVSAPDLAVGPYVGASADNRLKFYVSNATTENLYFGFDMRNYANSGNPLRVSNGFYRIYDSATNTVQQQGAWNSATNSAGSIDTYAEAVAGPNIGGVTTGYSPLVFNPTVSGEYYIVIYRGVDINTPDTALSGRVFAGLLDLTVADNSGAFAKHNGRLYSDKWSCGVSDDLFNIDGTKSADPIFYAYTDDPLVANDETYVKVDFEVGFKPLAFNLSLNKYGVSNGAWLQNRRSVTMATAPTLSNGYKVFVNVPDLLLFPVATIPSNPQFLTPAISGCGPTYTINYSVERAGDVKLLLDLNGTPGFQNGTSDRVLEAFDVSAGNNVMIWNGLNGLGTAVPSGSSVNLALTYLSGRFNLPLYDAEINSGGFKISITEPVAVANATLYWDDSALTTLGICTPALSENSNNTTAAGNNNSYLGITSPAHAWNGTGNTFPVEVIPAPTAGGGDGDVYICNDWGNARVINTWGWGYTSSATNLNIVIGCPDLQVTKTVNNSTPNYGSNVTFTITVRNNGTTNATGVVVADALPTGYTIVGSPTVSSGTWSAPNWTIGNLANGVTQTMTIIATVNTNGNYANTATVTCDESDSTTGNNSATVTVTPLACRASVAPILIRN